MTSTTNNVASLSYARRVAQIICNGLYPEADGKSLAEFPESTRANLTTIAEEILQALLGAPTQQDEREAFKAYNPLGYVQMDGLAVWHAACAWQRAQQVLADAGAKPFAWFRRRSDGYLEGPIFDGDERICDTRRAFWTPLYTCPSPAGESDKRDSARLDWLMRNVYCDEIKGLDDLPYGCNKEEHLKNFREAIDAAMSREQSQEGDRA